MANRTMALRYAKALAEVLPHDDLRRVDGELRQVSELLDDEDLQRTLGSAALPRRRRQDLAEKVFAGTGFHKATRKLLVLLAGSGHFTQVGAVSEAFTELCDRRQQIVAAEITTAVAVDTDKQEQYKRALEKMTGKQVRLKTRIDPAILGGVVTRIGSEVYDGSLRGQLQKLHQRLKGE